MIRIRNVALVWSAVLSSAICSTAVAQDKASGPTVRDELALKQGQLADKYARLEDLLFKLSALEQSTNPRRAALLQRAIQQSKDKLTKSQLDTVSRLLQQNQLKRAVDGQTTVQADLKSLLDLLMSEDRSERLKSEQQRIKEYIKEVERLIRLERSLQGQTEGGGDTKKLAEDQNNIAGRTEELAKKIKETEEGQSGEDAKPQDGDAGKPQDNPNAKPNAEPKPGDMKPAGGDPIGKPMPGDPKEGKPGENGDQPKPGEPKPGEPKPGEPKPGEPKPGEPKPGEPKPGEPQESKPGDMKPGERPSDMKPEEGKPSESPADDGKPMEGKPNAGKPSESKPMPGGPMPPQDGDSPQSGDSPPPPQNQNDNPARKRLEQAQESMKKAQQKLAEAKRKESLEDQQKAREELEQAKAELEQILRQLREEEVERTLAMLEARFRKMLEMQLKVYESTRRLDQVAEAERTNDFVVQAGKLSFEERKIALEAQKALTLLTEEGSSVAFPASVEQIKNDMEQVTQRLGDAKVDEVTLGIEEDIIAALEDMVEALQQAQQDLEKQKEQQQQQQQQQGEQEQALVDKIAELKMIRALQERVNKRTNRYARLLDDDQDLVGQALTNDLIDALQKLGVTQQEIRRITRDIVVGKNK